MASPRSFGIVVAIALNACLAPAEPAAVGDDGSVPVDAGSGGNAAGSLSPLAVGRTWTYDVTSTYPSCQSGTHDTKVTAASVAGGRQTLTVENYCGSIGYSNVMGDRVEEYYNYGPSGWMRSLDVPVSDGHTWRTTNGSTTFDMAYDHIGTYEGHADCWRVTQQVAYESSWIYCRAVGLVKYEMIDLAGGTIVADLVRTNF